MADSAALSGQIGTIIHLELMKQSMNWKKQQKPRRDGLAGTTMCTPLSKEPITRSFPRVKHCSLFGMIVQESLQRGHFTIGSPPVSLREIFGMKHGPPDVHKHRPPYSISISYP